MLSVEVQTLKCKSIALTHEISMPYWSVNHLHLHGISMPYIWLWTLTYTDNIGQEGQDSATLSMPHPLMIDSFCYKRCGWLFFFLSGKHWLMTFYQNSHNLTNCTMSWTPNNDRCFEGLRRMYQVFTIWAILPLSLTSKKYQVCQVFEGFFNSPKCSQFDQLYNELTSERARCFRGFRILPNFHNLTNCTLSCLQTNSVRCDRCSEFFTRISQSDQLHFESPAHICPMF
jgi:hypothetical protein